MVRGLCPWQTGGASAGVAVVHSQAIHELKLYLCVRTQHTCGSRPYLATLRTAAAAADTNNSSGSRGTPVRLPRNAVAAAAARVPPNRRAAAAPILYP